MAYHDYKVVSDTFKEVGDSIGMGTVINGFTKTIDSRVVSPVLQFESVKSSEMYGQNKEEYEVTADFLIYFNADSATTTDTFEDKWREIETLINNFMAGVDNSEQVRIISDEIEKERFGYGFTANNFIPIRVVFKVVVSC
jgi:hypothetical protein